MILTVEELRRYIETDETDDVLSMWLEAMTQLVHNHTHNNFHKYMQDGEINYPADVKMGVVNLMKWELNQRDKVGVASESISRHSVTYSDQTGENTINGYPTVLMGFLKPYKRARFGQWGGHS